ncbi:MAG: tetratricopeptide repeat protein [Bdellovibrionota bacterium]
MARKRFSRKTLVISAAALGLLGAVVAAVYLVPSYRASRAMGDAKYQLTNGFPVVAAETLEEFRSTYVTRSHDCQVLISAYYQARKAERLGWATEACLFNHHESLEAYLGMAASREMMGREPEAVTILKQVASKFDETPAVYFTLAQLLRRMGRKSEAVDAYRDAVRRSRDSSTAAVELVQLLTELGRFGEASEAATALKSAPVEGAEARMIVARALLKGGDRVYAKIFADGAMSAVASDPALKAQIQKDYADVLKGVH